MKNDSNPIIRSEEITIDMHIRAALSESRSVARSILLPSPRIWN